MDKIDVYTDGGSRNNPGNAGVGVVINDLKFKKYIGIRTNNEAEYEAVIFALEKLKDNFTLEELNNSKIVFHLDSELVCKQINREYKIKDEKLGKLFLKIYNLKLDLNNIEFVHVRREFNKEADKLVNEALDEYEKGAK